LSSSLPDARDKRFESREIRDERPERFSAEGAAIYQPRATPWVQDARKSKRAESPR
jgi:hypothetical protein